MADHDVIRKLRVYRALYRLNRAFAHITRNLDQLLIAEVFKEDIPDEDRPHGWHRQLAQVQMEINRRLTENLHRMEHGDIMTLARIEAIDPRIRDLHYPKPRSARRRKG
jgi:hypothetical protein